MSSKPKKTISWDEDAIKWMADTIHVAITGGRPILISQFKELARSMPLNKIGFSFIWILTKSERILEFFPDEIAEILSSRLKRFRFDSFAIDFIKQHKDMTHKQIARLFFVDRETIASRTNILGVKLIAERHRFTEEEDKIIETHAANDIGLAAKLIGVSRGAAEQRARILEFPVPRHRFVKYSQKELQMIRKADLEGKSDEEIAKMLVNRTADAVSRKRQQLRKLRKQLFLWRDHPEKWQFVLNHYKTMTFPQIAKKLHLRYSQVMKKAWNEGLVKRPKPQKEEKAP